MRISNDLGFHNCIDSKEKSRQNLPGFKIKRRLGGPDFSQNLRGKHSQMRIKYPPHAPQTRNEQLTPPPQSELNPQNENQNENLACPYFPCFFWGIPCFFFFSWRGSPCFFERFSLPFSRAAKRGGFKRGGFPIWTCPSFSFFVLFGTFPIFLGISRLARGWSGDFPDLPFSSFSTY